MADKILVTGGAGYIGSHTIVELMNSGVDVIVIDNFINSDVRVFDRIEKICGKKPTFVKADVRDESVLDEIFLSHIIDGVIHFAGLKAVGESVSRPVTYYQNNIGTTLSLLQAMDRANVRRIVFSSSATVYGDPSTVPIKECSSLQVTNPYGSTKLMCETILRDLQMADPRWHFAILRYFNPVGAHASGLIGENPSGIPNNLMPFIAQVATGQRDILNIFGNDYPTPDGTGVRDYIHVVDLAKGHVAALKYLEEKQKSLTVNLGTGHGVSVKELVETFERVNGQPIPRRFVARRAGDVANCYADTSLAKDLLNWSAQYGVEKMCLDTWNWQSKNPDGYC
ncbi:UDP-glucose 4-epimerase GalE [Limnohabitans sp.]|uniref:UDP-glucose 4-epimerase GalE n=1 Tax=Limnohabitans sp. TaxID=1907725 RepID=UPI002AFDC95C|nr:UDP-glucose 4-epimerase GalE [Limnohabitans sp.]